jgi:hypothetical protein
MSAAAVERLHWRIWNGNAKNAQGFIKQKGNSANISVTGPQAPSSINST